jgi:hypothetical protein
MQALFTKEDARKFFGLKTIEATERLLQRLGVPKMNFSIIGGKGIRYRKTDIEEALAQIEMRPKAARRGRKPKPQHTDIFDLPVKEQIAILTAGGSPQ